MATLPMGARVRVHLNLHRGDWSVTVRGKVVANVDSIALANVTFWYWEGGHAKIMAARDAGHPRRRVCAWAIGDVAAVPPGLPETEITYNPYRANCFTTRAGVPVARCQYVRFEAGKRAVACGGVS